MEVDSEETPSQNRRAVLENHVGEFVPIDFSTVSTAALGVLIVPAHDRRRIVHFNATEHPRVD